MWWDILFETIPKKEFSAGDKLLNFYYTKRNELPTTFTKNKN